MMYTLSKRIYLYLQRCFERSKLKETFKNYKKKLVKYIYQSVWTLLNIVNNINIAVKPIVVRLNVIRMMYILSKSEGPSKKCLYLKNLQTLFQD